MIGVKIDFMQVRTYVLPKVFVKFTRKSITSRGFIISHGINHFFKVLESEKLLTESTLLNCKAVWSNSDALSECFLLSNRSSLRSKNVLIVMNKCLQDVREAGENRVALFDYLNPNIGMMSLEELL